MDQRAVSAVIALALEQQAKLVLLDELTGRCLRKCGSAASATASGSSKLCCARLGSEYSRRRAVIEDIGRLRSNMIKHLGTVKQCLRLKSNYFYSYFDSLILTSAFLQLFYQEHPF